MTPSIPLLGDEIDEIVYYARANELSELAPYVESLAHKYNASAEAILVSAIDPETGNSALHYAGANGHTELLGGLTSYLPRIRPPNSPAPTQTEPSSFSSEPEPAASSPPPLINHRNKAGNTPLHWAALNGHLPAVRLLLERGADASILNSAGHDAVFEAELAEKHEVVEFLLKEALGLETGVGGGRRGQGEGEDDACGREEDGGEGGIAEEGDAVDGLPAEERVRDGMERLGLDDR